MKNGREYEALYTSIGFFGAFLPLISLSYDSYNYLKKGIPSNVYHMYKKEFHHQTCII